MKKTIAEFVFALWMLLPVGVSAQLKPSVHPLATVTAAFTAPDNICVNTPVQLQNNSVGATNYYWSFCEADFTTAVDAVNLGNVGNQLSLPVFTDIVQDDNGDYYVFVVNNYPGQLVRMKFGNSLLNAPIIDNMGDFGGAISPSSEGIQIVRVNGNWVIVIVGGDPAGGIISSIMKIDLGTSLASTTGVGTNWGDIGILSYPHDLYLFSENNIWYGLTVNARNNTLTRFNFGADFANPPTAVNLGNIGTVNGPVGIGVTNNLGNWYAFLTNSTDGTITRLNFGNSLLNTPTGINIGNPGNSLDNPRDISFIRLCSGIEALVVDGNSGTVTKLDFGNDLLAAPTGTSLGNLGNLDFPHSISSLFRVNSDIYAFVTNVNNNTITRLHFPGCTTSGSNLQNPTNITYTQPGTYNINLLVDLGLPTQTSFCKQIVVKPCTLATCDNWLSLPSNPSAVEVGQLNVPGNQITVEAEINRTTPYTGGILFAGDIVSKHKDPSDANYLLRPNEAEITTTNGYFRTPDICEIELNKTYHVAMVYDGSTLKFYRNGFLMSQVAASGNLFQNTWPTHIGYYFSELYNTNFIGYINEVRIWNIARTQAQLQTYMNTPLPSPTTQIGLLAYYTFDDLLNKQGNPAWNGTIVGSAVINQTNPTCSSFIADSCCPVLQGTLTGESICSGSTATLTFNATGGTAPFTLVYSDGTNTFTQTGVQSNTPFVLSTQPTANTTYSLVSIQDAGTCPPTPVTGITATINVNACSLCKGSLGDPVVNITFGSGDNPGQPLPNIVAGASTTLTYVPVTGNPATPTIEDGQYTITNNIPVNDGWFSGGGDHTPTTTKGYMAFYNASPQPGEFYSQTITNLCGSTTYEFAAWIANVLNPARVVGVLPNITFTIAQPDGTLLGTYNTGDIAQTAVLTWKQYGLFFTTPSSVSTIVIKMINNNPGGAANGNDLAIDDITLKPCGPVTTASFSVAAAVDSIVVCTGKDTTLFGTVSAGYNAPAYLWQSSVDGGNTWTDISNSNSLSINTTAAVAVGGVRTTYKYRMMTGEGANINSPSCRVGSNIVTLVINPSPQAQLTGGDICIGQDGILLFTASAGTAPFNIQYSSGTGNYMLTNVANNTAFTVPFGFTDTTTFTLLTATDANGCVEDANNTTTINVKPLPEGGITVDDIACSADSVAVTYFSLLGTAPFQVVLSDGTNTATYYGIQSGIPFKIFPLDHNFILSLVSVTDEDGNGCTRTSNFTSPNASVVVKPSPQIKFDSLAQVCADVSTFQLTQVGETSGIAGTGVFSGDGVDGNGNFNPAVAGLGVHLITYTFSANNGCNSSKSQNLVVNANPVANAGVDLIGCMGISIQLHATGGTTYAWTPVTGLSDSSIANPVALVNSTTTYTVTVTDQHGCTNTDDVTIAISPAGKAIYVVPNAFTPNGDGKNDCFGIQHWGGIQLQEFSIFNRWGQRVFATKNPSECWDGSFKGNMQDAGTYVYFIKAQTPCGDVNLKGTVILVK